MSEVIKPMLDFLQGYRQRVAVPPENRIYKQYPDLHVIKNRMEKIEVTVDNEIEQERQRIIERQKQIELDYIAGMEAENEDGSPNKKGKKGKKGKKKGKAGEASDTRLPHLLNSKESQSKL